MLLQWQNLGPTKWRMNSGWSVDIFSSIRREELFSNNKHYFFFYNKRIQSDVAVRPYSPSHDWWLWKLGGSFPLLFMAGSWVWQITKNNKQNLIKSYIVIGTISILLKFSWSCFPVTLLTSLSTSCYIWTQIQVSCRFASPHRGGRSVGLTRVWPPRGASCGRPCSASCDFTLQE